MTQIKTIFVSATLGITLATGIVLAQAYPPPQLFGRPDPELKAARESLDDALAHLLKARDSDSERITQARGYVVQALAVIDPNFNSFAAPVAPPPAARAPK
jgi:hypothetical protein